MRQSNAIKKDLATFTDAPASGNAALQGQINASLTSFSRTVEDYARLAKQEIVEEKKEKAANRVKNFRAEITDFREQYEKLKKEREEAVSTKDVVGDAEQADRSLSKPPRAVPTCLHGDLTILLRPRTHTRTSPTVTKHQLSSLRTKAY